MVLMVGFIYPALLNPVAHAPSENHGGWPLKPLRVKQERLSVGILDYSYPCEKGAEPSFQPPLEPLSRHRQEE